MGRYYAGDIEGKFWFGVQSSDDADFFGCQGQEPQELQYSFAGDDLPTIEEGIAECKEKLGDQKAKLEAFFAEGGEGEHGYDDERLSRYLGLPWDGREVSGGIAIYSPVKDALEWYARLELGEKILACVKEKGECEFTAEL